TEQLGGGDRSPLVFVPHQQLLLARDPRLFQAIASEAGLTWYGDPPAVRLADWAGGLDEWARALTWRRDPGFRGAHAYDPWKFQPLPLGAAANVLSRSLQRVSDRLTDRHFLYQLCRRDGSEVRYASVDQKAWGCWLVQREAWRQSFRRQTQNASVLIPYDP